MELNRKQWFVHWFFVSLAIVTRFRDGDSWCEEYRYRNGTNLCHFMRVILVWAPFVVLLNLTAYGLVLCAVIVTPIYVFGVSSYVGVVLGVGSILIIATLVVFGLHFLGKFIGQMEGRARQKRLSKTLEETPASQAEAPKGPKFRTVLWQYAVSTKRRFCPNLTFNTQEMSS